MLPDNVFRPPLTAFARPVPGILVDPNLGQQIYVNFNPAWLGTILGALKPLTLSTTWDISDPDAQELQQKRAMLLLSMFAGATNSDRPFFQDAEEASDESLPDYPWYEQIEDWVISLFLAVAATPGAAIVYRATIPKIRLVLRTGDLGAIFRVLIDGLEFITGDNYSPIKQLVEHVIDVQDFADQHSLGPGPHMIKILNVGRTSGPGGDVLEVVRGDIRPEVSMFDIRWNGCTLEKTEDGGVTWNSVGDITDCATAIADTEIAAKVRFNQSGIKLQDSLTGGAPYTDIYDPTTQVTGIADTEIAAKVRFNQSGIKLQDSLTGGAPYTDIYDPTTQVTGIADTEIQNNIQFSQDGIVSQVSLNNGAQFYPVYDPTSQVEAMIAAAVSNLVPPSWQSRPVPGASKSFDLICRAGQHVLLPCYVLAGDVVTVSNITGAWADASLATGSGSDHAPTWYRPDGFVYDTGLPSPTDGTFGMPTMALIARSDGSSIIPVYDGTAHTLDDPAQLGRMWFLAAHVMNFQEAYPPGIGTPPDYYRIHQLDVSGYAAFRVTVTVPAPLIWNHTFDAAHGLADWITIAGRGQWTGVYWDQVDIGGGTVSMYLYFNVPVLTDGAYTRVDAFAYDNSPILIAGRIKDGPNWTGNEIGGCSNGNPLTPTGWTGGGTLLYGANTPPDSGLTISKVVIYGTGTDPFI